MRTTKFMVQAVLRHFWRSFKRQTALLYLGRCSGILCAALLLSYSTAKAQVPAIELKALRVGDKLPSAFWQQEHRIYANGQSYQQTLAGYKDKPLILDFWATWCSSCIYKFNTLIQWQKTYKDQLGILLVNSQNTKDKAQRVADLLEGKRSPFLKFELPSIINDSYLDALFPHGSLPHYVWIGATSTIVAISNADFVNAAQLESFLKINTLKP